MSKNLLAVTAPAAAVAEFMKSREGVLSDAVFTGRLYHDPQRDIVVAIFEHPAFLACSEGDPAEELTPLATHLARVMSGRPF